MDDPQLHIDIRFCDISSLHATLAVGGGGHNVGSNDRRELVQLVGPASRR